MIRPCLIVCDQGSDDDVYDQPEPLYFLLPNLPVTPRAAIHSKVLRAKSGKSESEQNTMELLPFRR